MREKLTGHVAQDGVWKGLHPAMGIASKGMVAAFVVFTVLNVEFANAIYSSIRGWIESALNWYYISALVVMLFVCFYLMFSRHGAVKLGDDDSKPEFSNFSWFAMLFSAGVGIGLLFFGIAEPVFYFDNTEPWGYPNNPFADQALVTQMDTDRAVYAMRVTYFHWGFHGWAVYVMIGLCLAYFGFRKKLPLTCARRSIRSSATGSTGRSAMRSTCWRSSVRSSASQPRWAWVSARWPPDSIISSAWIQARRPN